MKSPSAAGMAASPNASARVATPEDTAYRKVARRLLPFVFICYIFNYIDRLNVGFAHMGLRRDLGFTDAAFGLGVGMFFVGYLLFELPSTMLLERFGARKTLTRIMVLWGICSTSMMFMTTTTHFYVLRLLLGVAEAGFLPGIVLYLTYWYPAHLRGRATAFFTSSLPVAGIISGPVSGWIMGRMDRVAGLHNWQWLFLLEGIPSIVLGIVAYFYLSDKPASAKWLTADERHAITKAVAQRVEDDSTPVSFATMLKDRRVYLVAFLGFASYCSANTIAFWTPTIIKDTGLSDAFLIGILSAVPSVAGLIGMLWCGRHSDRTLERRWHAAVPALAAALGLGLLPLFHHNTAAAVALLALAGAGHFAFVAVFWTIPPAFLGRKAAAGGIGLIASLSSLGGVVVPIIVGWARTATGNFTLGMVFVVTVLILAVIALLVGIPAHALRETAAE